ncbi:hypothetical protein BHM03_00048486 [Ensete ventricosum]|nr:hypothetical protein BHM03_00048486 [Ensete ventricosum]
MRFTVKADLFGIMPKVTFPLVARRGADKGSDPAGSSATKIWEEDSEACHGAARGSPVAAELASEARTGGGGKGRGWREDEEKDLQRLDEALAPLHGDLVEGHGTVLRPPLLHPPPPPPAAAPAME